MHQPQPVEHLVAGVAFIEAANFAIRFNPAVKRYYERKLRRSAHRLIALKAVAHKLARACYFVMRDGCAFDVQRAFGPAPSA